MFREKKGIWNIWKECYAKDSITGENERHEKGSKVNVELGSGVCGTTQTHRESKHY